MMHSDPTDPNTSHRYSQEYRLVPPPPPLIPGSPYPDSYYSVPPQPRQKALVVAVVCLSCLVVVLGGALFTVLYRDSQSQKPATSFFQTFTPSETNSTPSSTLSGPLDSSDLATFIAAFNNAIAARNWRTLAAHTDTANFLNQYSYNGGDPSGNEGWASTVIELQQGNLKTKVDIPTDFVNSNASLSCAKYGMNGVEGHQVEAHQVYYIYAWGVNSHLSVNGVIMNPLRQIDAFEQINPNGSWQWLGIFSDMLVTSDNTIVLDCEP